jgi:predicted nucleic acid-binding protein
MSRLATYAVVPTDADLVISATELSDRHQLSLWDAMILPEGDAHADRSSGC